jgi:hypothetical protein
LPRSARARRSSRRSSIGARMGTPARIVDRRRAPNPPPQCRGRPRHAVSRGHRAIPSMPHFAAPQPHACPRATASRNARS